MKNLKLIYGTDTGKTENVINDYLLDLFNENFKVEVVEVLDIKPEDWESHDFYVLGIPTWYDGLLQSDWEDYFDDFQEIDFTDKTVALFGLGDQIGYAEYFCDGIGILAESIIKNGGKIIGSWSKEEYEYLKSKAEMNETTLYGLALDEDNEDDLTQERCQKWVEQLKNEINA